MSYDSEILTDRPYLFWELNESVGTIAYDSAGNGHPGNYTNGPTKGAPSLIVGGRDTDVSFDAALNQSIIQNDSYSPGALTAFTLETIFSPTATALSAASSLAGAAIFGWYQSTPGQNLALYISQQLPFTPAGSLFGVASNTTTIGLTAATLVAGQTYHVVYVYDGTSQYTYVNGVLTAQQNIALTAFTVSGKFYAGSSPFFGPFDGTIGPCSFYTYALTPDRISVHAQAAQGVAIGGIVSTDDLITQVEDHLLGGDRDELNFLANDVQIADTTVTLTDTLGSVAQGAYLGIDLEVMYVKSVDPNGLVATVQRGMVGSPIGHHFAGTLVAVNPLFHKWMIWKALNTEITSLSAADNGLFAEKAFTVLSKPIQKTYDVPVNNADMRRILEIRYDAIGPEKYWPVVGRRQFQIIRDVTMDSPTATGLALRMEASFVAGRRIVVRYAGDFSQLSTNLNDNAADTTGLTANMIDIPTLGAAARLMGVREAKRSFVERSVDSRRAAEVPSGSSSRAAGVLLQLLNGRIKSEADRLRHLWPIDN